MKLDELLEQAKSTEKMKELTMEELNKVYEAIYRELVRREVVERITELAKLIR